MSRDVVRLNVKTERKFLHKLYSQNRKDLRKLKEHKEKPEFQKRIKEKEKFLKVLDGLIQYLLNLNQKTISERKFESKQYELENKIEEV